MQQTLVTIAALAATAFAQSYTPPTDATFGALYTPDLTNPVTQGETFKVTWDATGHEQSTVSLVLCRGSGANCVNDPNAIVSKIPAASQSYEWAVPCTLPVGKQQTSTGYGMLIIEDGTGVFQYSTQFSVLQGSSCGSGSSSSSTTANGSDTTTATPTTSGGKPGPSMSMHNGTMIGGYTERTGAWTTDSTSTVAAPSTSNAMGGIPTDTPTAGAVGSATGSVTWSTATQPSATRPTSTATGVSGAERNAAGMMFLGAVGAAFLL